MPTFYIKYWHSEKPIQRNNNKILPLQYSAWNKWTFFEFLYFLYVYLLIICNYTYIMNISKYILYIIMHIMGTGNGNAINIILTTNLTFFITWNILIIIFCWLVFANLNLQVNWFFFTLLLSLTLIVILELINKINVT